MYTVYFYWLAISVEDIFWAAAILAPKSFSKLVGDWVACGSQVDQASLKDLKIFQGSCLPWYEAWIHQEPAFNFIAYNVFDLVLRVC